MSDLTRHVDLLAALLARDAQRVSAAKPLESFPAFARRHQISGFLHLLTNDPEARTLLPPDLAGRFRRRYAMEARKRELIQRELGSVIDALLETSVDSILLKGPHLAERYYGRSDGRAYWDLDLLIRRDHLDAARRALESRGYRLQSMMLLGQRLSTAAAHALDFSRGEVGLDLHWKLSAHPSFRVDYNRLWQRTETWSLSGSACRVLSPDYELTLNLLSSFKDIERGAFRMRSFVDLWMILSVVDAELDWEQFFAERREENIATLCHSVLELFLLVLRASARFPHVAQALAGRGDSSRVRSLAGAMELLAPAFFAPRRRLWASRQYRISTARHVAWWAASLPVRLYVHKPGKMKRLSHRMGGWLRRHR